MTNAMERPMPESDAIVHTPEALPWQPISPGFSLKVLHGGSDDETRALLLRLEPGTVVGLHKHSGEVHALQLSGRRRIEGVAQEVGPGGYVYEPPGNLDTWSAAGDEPLVIFVTVRGVIDALGPQGEVVSRSTTAGITESYRRYVASLQ
jgi:quercetin dioxygenase-like cupin family protein